jgi:RNA polymerase sigma-70 factor, ECF subfamily
MPAPGSLSRRPAREPLPFVLSVSGKSPPIPPSRPRPRDGVVHALPVHFRDAGELARAAAQRHPAAARVIWERFSTLVRGLLRRTLGPGPDVEDLVQETFLRFFDKVNRLREPDKLQSFVVGVTMRVAREELRRRRVRRWVTLSAGGELPERVAPDVGHEAAEALGRLYRLLDRIDSRSRVLFVLRFVEEQSLEDIAHALDCSLATVKRWLRTATHRVEQAALRDESLKGFMLRTGGGADD